MRATERDALTATLSQLMASCGGTVSGKDLARTAAGFGISTRTVRRHLATLHSPSASTARTGWWEDSGQQKAVFAAVAGCDTLKQAWSQLQAAGVLTVSYVHFTKQWNANVHPAVSASLRGDGREDYLKSSIYCQDVAVRPNTRWQADSQEVPVWVRPDNGQAPFKPWQVTFIDEATRMVMSTILLPGPPSGEDALAALAAGVNGFHTADFTFVGGIPETVKWDNGAEFVNRTVSSACLRLNIATYPAAPYSPWQKGKVERWHRTIQTELYSHLPGASDGPRSFGGHEWWRGANAGLLPFSALVLKLEDWVTAYNTERVHSSLASTPLEAWKNAGVHIVRATTEQLHPLMLRASRTRTVGRDGISFEGRRYLSPALAKYRGRKVEVRYLPTETDTIFVFDGDQFICQAGLSEKLTVDQRRTLVAKRHADWQTIKSAHRQAVAARAQKAAVAAAAVPKQKDKKASKKVKEASRPNNDSAALSGIFADGDALLDVLGGDDR